MMRMIDIIYIIYIYSWNIYIYTHMYQKFKAVYKKYLNQEGNLGGTQEKGVCYTGFCSPASPQPFHVQRSHLAAQSKKGCQLSG